jgi:hypothetical protein
MKALKIAGLVFAIIIVLIGSLWWACGPHQPSDAELERQFERHRSDLDRLVQMTDQDWQMSRIAPDFTWQQDTVAWPRPESEWGISRQRWDEYRRIFVQAGFRYGITRREKSSDIIVDVWSWGIVPAGVGVGYLHCGPPMRGYSPTEEPCIENRNLGSGMHGKSTSYGYRYRKIAQDWYIYEESN